MLRMNTTGDLQVLHMIKNDIFIIWYISFKIAT